MNAEEFIKKYPTAPERGNCLEDMGCPNCGQRDELIVQAAIYVGLKDEGSDAYSDSTKHFGDTEYTPKSPCVCPDCNHSGQLQDFTFDGLDELIYKNNQHENT